MFLFVFAGAKRRSGEISKFQFLIPVNWGVATFILQKVPESAGYFCAALSVPQVYSSNRLEHIQ